MKDTSRAEEVMRGIGNALSESAEAQRFGCRERGRIDDCLLIEQIVIESQQEARTFAVAQRPGHRSFVILATLRRLHQRKGIAGVER